MKTFICVTEDFVKSYKTEVTEAISAGSNIVVKVISNQGFTVDDFVILKREGTEQAHLARISETIGNDYLKIQEVKYDLEIGDPVVKIDYNQRKLYGSLTKDGEFVLVETKDIAVDNPQGTYFGYTGDYIWFKATYYNTITSIETSLDDAIAVEIGEPTRYCSIYDIREESGFLDNDYIDDGRIDNLRLQAEAEVKASIGSVYKLPLSANSEVIRTITKLLAAGWLMWQEYGSEASGTSKDGIAKVEQARSMLKAIRENRLKLFDENDVELARASDSISGGTISGYPDSTTPDSEKAQFRIDQIF